ncbi:MAG: Biotin/lipoate A/B protein ligase [Pycnora praestabilis]|nr:MAG: Biotin/lipoate A/B protein ligase [Pycnora praestabilis]
MAPSRGCSLLCRNQSRYLLTVKRSSSRNPGLTRSSYSTSQSAFTSLAARQSSKYQVYVSRSTDPYLNLSIEHFLLQKTPADSTILFLYTDRPCVVIGRNQNPWLEVNLRLLQAANASQGQDTESPSIGDVILVRRRSGGGTVFHDEGNVNYSVICPPADFSRDKHAEMVVRALRDLGIDRARVNERHDIVLDQGPRNGKAEIRDAFTTAYMTPYSDGLRALKVSGSAYKLTRLRSLHHGTCLLTSPNLNVIPHYLHSPAKPYIKARGVESVSSPVGNLGFSNEVFERAVINEFGAMYGLSSNISTSIMESHDIKSSGDWCGGIVRDAEEDVAEIAKGLQELKSLDWTYNQTPQFTFSSYQSEEDDRGKPALPMDLPSSVCDLRYLTSSYSQASQYDCLRSSS